MIFISFANLVYFLGIQQALFSYFYKQKDDHYQFTIISTIYITLIIFGSFLTFLIIFFRNNPFFSRISNNNIQFFIYGGIISLMDVIYGITMNILNIKERSKNYAFLSIIRNLLFLFLVIFGTIMKRIDLQNIFIYLTFSSIFSAFIAIINISFLMKKLWNKLHKRVYFSLKILKPLLKFGLLMIPGTLAMIALRVSDRYMLTFISKNALYDVGIYATGYRIGMIMQFPVSIVSMVYFPYAMRISDQPFAFDSYRSTFKFYVIFGGILGFLIIIFSPEIFYLFIDKSYFEASKIVFCGVISVFLLGVFNIINISFYLKQKAGNIALTTILGALLNIALNFILIPRFGIYGAGWASIIAYFFIVCYNYIVVEKIHSTNYNFLIVIITLIILTGTSTANYYLPHTITIAIIKLISVTIIMSIIAFWTFRNRKLRSLLGSIFNEDLKK